MLYSLSQKSCPFPQICEPLNPTYQNQIWVFSGQKYFTEMRLGLRGLGGQRERGIEITRFRVEGKGTGILSDCTNKCSGPPKSFQKGKVSL